MIDDTGSFNDFGWSTAITTANFIVGSTDGFFFPLYGGTSYHPISPDKNWMPYKYFEYEPIWHKKYARYKIQMENMWKDESDSA